MGNPLDADLGRRQPAVTIAQPDEEVGARPLEPNGVEPALVELRSASAKPVEMLVPSGHRVGLVEAGRGRHCLPEALDVWLPEDGVRPARVRVADDRPLDQPPVLRVQELLGREPRACPLGTPLVGVGEKLGLRFAGDRDRRAAGVDQVVDERERPGRAPVERVLGCVLDTRAAHVHVAELGLHVACAALVGELSDRANKRQMLRLGVDAQELTRLEVDRHLHRQARVPFEPLVRSHAVEPYSVCRVNAPRRSARTGVVASSRCSSRRSPAWARPSL